MIMMMRRGRIAVVIIVIVVTTTTAAVMRIREEGRGVMGMVVGMLMVIVRVMTTADGAAEAEGRDLPTEFVDGHCRRLHLIAGLRLWAGGARGSGV